MSAKLNIPNNNHGPVVRLAVVWGSGALIATGSLVRCLSAGKISVAMSQVLKHYCLYDPLYVEKGLN